MVPARKSSDADIATYVVRLVLAHEDCKGQLKTLENHLKVNDVLITNDLPVEHRSEKASKKFFSLF